MAIGHQLGQAVQQKLALHKFGDPPDDSLQATRAAGAMLVPAATNTPTLDFPADHSAAAAR